MSDIKLKAWHIENLYEAEEDCQVVLLGDAIALQQRAEAAESQLVEVKSCATGQAPCEKYCEARAVEIEMRKLRVENERLSLYESEHERLKVELNKILHPNGDGPEKPSFCDLVGYVQKDLATAEQRVKELEGIIEGSYLIRRRPQVGDLGVFMCCPVVLEGEKSSVELYHQWASYIDEELRAKLWSGRVNCRTQEDKDNG